MKTLNLIEAAGWSPQRHVADVEVLIARRVDGGHEVVDAARTFLTSHAGLQIWSRNRARQLSVDSAGSMVDIDPRLCAAYERGAGHRMTPVGAFDRMAVLIDARGWFWGGSDAMYGLLGSGFDAAVDALLVDPYSFRRLDQVVLGSQGQRR